MRQTQDIATNVCRAWPVHIECILDDIRCLTQASMWLSKWRWRAGEDWLQSGAERPRSVDAEHRPRLRTECYLCPHQCGRVDGRVCWKLGSHPSQLSQQGTEAPKETTQSWSWQTQPTVGARPTAATRRNGSTTSWGDSSNTNGKDPQPLTGGAAHSVLFLFCIFNICYFFREHSTGWPDDTTQGQVCVQRSGRHLNVLWAFIEYDKMQPLIALMKLVTRPCQIEVTPSVRKVRRGFWNLKAPIFAGRLGPWIPTKLNVA